MSINRHKSFDPCSKKAIDRLYRAEIAAAEVEEQMKRDSARRAEHAQIQAIKIALLGKDHFDGLEWMYDDDDCLPVRPSKTQNADTASTNNTTSSAPKPDSDNHTKTEASSSAREVQQSSSKPPQEPSTTSTNKRTPLPVPVYNPPKRCTNEDWRSQFGAGKPGTGAWAVSRRRIGSQSRHAPYVK